jgi:hypothetical protein
MLLNRWFGESGLGFLHRPAAMGRSGRERNLLPERRHDIERTDSVTSNDVMDHDWRKVECRFDVVQSYEPISTTPTIEDVGIARSNRLGVSTEVSLQRILGEVLPGEPRSRSPRRVGGRLIKNERRESP